MGGTRKEINKLFTYGTLMLDEIFFSITGKEFRSTPAYLINYQCLQVKNKIYPGLISGNGKVTGKLYHDIPAETFAKLDNYEGQEYRREIIVTHQYPSDQITAWCYLYKTELKNNLLENAWTLEWYKQNKKLTN